MNWNEIDEDLMSEAQLFSPSKEGSFGEQLLKSITSAANGQKYAPCWDEYDTIGCLGEGSYGKIYKVREKNGK